MLLNNKINHFNYHRKPIEISGMKIIKIPGFVRKIYANRTWNFFCDEPTVFLTFDDGPDPIVTDWVLQYLEGQQIKATFFCIGNNVHKYPQVFQRIKSEGHAFGNHSMHHENGYKTNDDAYFKSVQEANELIDSPLFRPPYGKITYRQVKFLKKNYKIIMWSWLSYDFDESFPIQKITQRGLKRIKSGDVLVFHDNVKSFERLKVLLPEVIAYCKSQGFQLAPIASIC